MREYRWDKRRAQREEKQRTSKVSVYDALMLFLVFCLGLWFYYSLLFSSISSSYCFEQIFAHGKTPITPTVYKSMYFISLALFLFWGCGLFAERIGKASWVRFVWDAIIGFSIVIICGLYFYLSTWNNLQPPHATLGIGEGVWTTERSTREWRKLPPMQMPLSWTDGKVKYFTDYHLQECVWLDSNKIAITREAPNYRSGG